MKHTLRYLAALCLACTTHLAHAASTDAFMAATHALQNRFVLYDSAYTHIAYPQGDVSPRRGVCSDVIIRAYRGIGIDLQQRVHEDMKKHFAYYPKLWGLRRADSNIDHRRVPNLQVFFKRFGTTLPITQSAADYAAGDIVTWNLREKGSLPHIGIVTDKKSRNGTPLIMHNIGYGQVTEDMLFDYTITGHYRYALD